MTPFPSLKGARPRRDLVAALTLAALAIPEQMATARLAGLPAAQGIAVFAAAALVMVLVARDKVLSVGADSTVAPVIATALVASGRPGDAAMIAAMVGLLLSTVAIFRLEWIARLLSLPVAAGMMAGIAVHILVGRLPTALGLTVPASSPVATLAAIAEQIASARLPPLALTLLVAAICVAGQAWRRRLPAPLLALALTAILASWLDPAATVFERADAADMGFGLNLPELRSETVLRLLPSALVVAFLVLFQTTVVLREYQSDTPILRRNAFAAVGLANIAAAAIGGFAVNASPPRTRILHDAGATSQWAGLGAAVIGLAVLLLVPGILKALPSAALAGILVFVALHIFPTALLRRIWADSRPEAVIALVTAALVTVLPLQLGLPLAMVQSLVYATLPLFTAQIVELTRVPGTTIWWHRPGSARDPGREDFIVMGLTSPLNFANAEGILAEIRRLVATRERPPRFLVLECAGLLSLDMTGADLLTKLIEELHGVGIDVALARIEADRARDQIAHSSVRAALGDGRVFDSVDQAVRALEGAS